MKARRATAGGFTLAEMMISVVGSSIIIGTLLYSSMQLQRSLHAGDVYAGCQADQHRLLDYVARDLRRAIGIATTQTIGGSGGAPLAGATTLVENGTSLVVTLPGYYASNDPAQASYDSALAVVAADNYVDYGTAAGHAGGVRVLFRKQYLAAEKCVCFVRNEAGADFVVVRNADNLHLEVGTAADGCSCTVAVSFTSPYGGNAPPLVATHDEILLRNVRLD